MKNWILTHKLLTVILACVIGAGAVCAVVLPITLRHEHKFSAEWTTDENYHWHECVGKKCKKVSDKAAHVFDKEEASETYLASAATYTDAARYYKSCICGVKGTETFSHGSSLSAKENVVGLKDGVTLGKTYDGEAYTLSEEQISRNGNGAITFTYKLKDSEAEFAEAAPENAGEYTVKVSVAATAEWKAATKTFDFAITPMVIGVDWEPPYNNKNVFSGEPAELLAGDEATITVTMSSANVGATVQSFEITGKDAGNYSLAIEDVNVEIVKADINFEISNASAFNELFFVGATNIPDPTTNYVEIGTGYGAKTIDWIMHLGDGVWSRTLTKDEVVGTAGEYRVRIQYAEGDNYNFGATQYVSFTVKKENVLTIKNIIGPDGNPIAGITDSTLGIKFGEDRINMQAQIDGLCEYLTNADNAEKYFIIRVQCGETVIARFERRGVQTMSDLNYVYAYGGMSFDNDRVTGMHFDLFGANEYVSAEGKWIGDEDLEVTIEITDSKDHPVLSKDSLQNSSSVGGGQIAVFEVQLPEGDDIICTFDVSWSGSPKNIEMVLYDAVTGSETSIVVKKVGENKFSFTETSGRKSFYLYVEELEATNNASGFTITASFETSTTRLEFPEGANELSSGELTYAAGEEKKFVISAGAGVSFGMKYTISNIPAGATVKVYREDGTEVTLSTDNSFELLRNVPVRDYTIVVTNTTDSNLNVNFSIKREQTSGTIVIS
ncbi:putative uncharacterized protein [Acidiphilium sp. CAG:727]|nr:putative uncharacterized protein [Acidiphilium sp. CAG:727]